MAQEVDFSTSTKSISQLKTAEDLTRKLDSLRRGRQVLENQWKINMAFYKGRQYVYFNRGSRRLESKPTEEGEKPRYIVRLVSNQIITGAHSLLSKFTKTKPRMAASPGSASEHDFKAAQMAERLLEYWWDDFQLEDKLEEALLWAIITGQGFWKISWDAHASKSMRFLLDPQGKPITDDTLKDLFTAQLKQMGVQPQEKVVYLGDIRVETISPFDVYLDPTARVFDDCKFAVCVHHLDPDEIRTRWGVDLKPDSVSAPSDATLPFGKTEESEPSVKRVNIGYFVPTGALPNGRYVVWVESPNQILEDGPWPYQNHELPLVKFPGLRVPGSIYDSSVVEHAIPLQKELNRTISQIVEYKNLTIRPRYFAPYNSIRERITNEPGAIYQFNPIGEHKPEAERLPTMPPYVFDHLQGIRAGLREVFGLSEVSEGTVPPNVEAGIAIDLLQEMSTDRVAPTIKLIESAIARAGQLMLSLAQKYYIEPRFMRIQGSGGASQVRRFTQADIDGGISISVESGSALPRTRAGRQARIMEFIKAGVLPAQQAYKHLDLGDLRGVAKAMAADEELALRIHDKIVEGIPINQFAVQSAMAQLQNGINPETGDELSGDPAEIQSVLGRASLQPLPYENLQVSLDVLHLFMTSPEFESLPPEVQGKFVTRYENIQQAMSQMRPTPEPQAPRVTYQIKSTAGPTASAELLNAAGLKGITPEVMSEPPLETWVSDKVDEPDQDEAGNDPLTATDVALKAQEYEHKERMADANVRAAEAKSERENVKTALERKRLAQSDFRPKRSEGGDSGS